MAAGFTNSYVEALLAVAGSADAASALLPDLDAFGRALDAAPDLREVLRNPAVDRARKTELLAAVTAKLGTAPLAARLLAVLLANRRLARLAEVIAAVRERLDRDRNVVEARVQAARPLTDAEAEGIRRALEGRTRRTVRLRTETEPALLGGFVVRIGSEVYDASLATRLARVRAALHEGSGN
ncbi:MAG TPA: ATP synthase F1 subunit delta [Thermoanaerobaculia bacterium]|nr:ATP synthase F1 subunit delta [Thermoanaerobaculia bacterium]HQR66293.1 ATP synthase F1 subunit delta [Thermoanaerobaculia bacterium]